MERYLYDKTRIIEELVQNPELAQLSKRGHCRSWTKASIYALKAIFPQISVEAREVEIIEELRHTFLKIHLNDHQTLLCDGVGVGKYPPYFGFEEDAPEHLRNSKPDVINQDLFLG